MFKFNDYFYLLLGLESFLYWSTFIISGMFLFTHITSLTQVLESKIPPIAKIVSLKSQKYLHVKPSYVSAPWVPGNLVVHVGHCLHLQVNLLELHLDFLLGSFGCFFDRFVSQVQELPIDHSRARTSNTSHCRSWEHVWYCEGVLEPRKKHFLFYFTQTIFLTNMYISLFQTP